MSSLPQGWHGIPVPTRNGVLPNMTIASTVPTTVRKKWNSSMSSEMLRSKLPSYKSSNLRTHKIPPSSTVPPRSAPKSSSSEPQSDQLSSTTKSSPSKQFQSEIAKLKKELTTMKTENSILKVKVRRVDDENVQKSKQIEKLRLELKTAQKVESTNSKKNKDSELLLLRQKCLRLEGALKEKDLALSVHNNFRRLDNGTSLKSEGTRTKKQSRQLEAGDTDDAKQAKLGDTKTLRKSGPTNLARSSQSIKTEVTKLREMIHKLEKGNQELQQQVKDKSEEIRRLKVHMRSQTYTKPAQSSIPKPATKIIHSAKPESTVPNMQSQIKVIKKQSSTRSNSSAASTVKNSISQTKKNSATQNVNKMLPKRPDVSQKKNETLTNRRSSSASSETSKTTLSTKQIYGGRSKVPVTQTEATFVVTNPISRKPEMASEAEDSLENKVQTMRENIAAKKIQRSWRNHQKQHINNDVPNQNLTKALTFIVTSLKHHRLRKQKLTMLSKQKNAKTHSPRLKIESENAIVEAIQAATKNLWKKELQINN